MGHLFVTLALVIDGVVAGADCSIPYSQPISK